VSSPTVTGRRPLIAVAGGPALLEPTHALRDAFTAVGATVTTVDLANDTELPPGTSAIALGDGAPIPHAAALAANGALREAVVAAHRAGVPVIAEGAGVGYLARSLDGHAMCDLLPTVATSGRGGVPGAVELLAASDGPLHRVGERRSGRPSAAIALEVTAGASPAWTVGRRREGWAGPGLHASLVVVPWTVERAQRLLAVAGAPA
jgi:cobyrinic acid a,c-diamide synthase